MRYFYILMCLSIYSYSQTNQSIINQAAQAAESQNITTYTQAIEALEARGMTETQARQLADQRGISFDQFVNEYFNEETNSESAAQNESNFEPNNNEDPENKAELELELDETDNIDYLIKSQTQNYFGYDIFNNNPFLDKEYLLGNIDEGYLISPGDEIRIIVYGDNSLETKLVVDRNGNINIPNFGIFFASGMSFKTLKSRLKIFLGKYLSGLVSTPQKTFMDVSLAQLKPTKVIVLGQVSSPGPHLLNTSGSTLAALYAAGGVKLSGSLRDILIYRNNKLFKRIDLYDYITTGELKDDVRLTNNDIVFVPNRKNSIELKGEIKRTGIYEILDGEDLSTLIKYSGGIPATTQTNKVNIQRIIPAKDRTSESIINRQLITIDYQKILNENNNVDLFDGDQIIFFRILDLESDQVTISGNVFNPGTYSLKSYTSLKSLIFDAGNGIMPNTFLEKVDVYSLVNGISVLNSYNLSDVILGSTSVKLMDGDRAIIYDNLSVKGPLLVTISGFGIDSTTIGWSKNLSLYDFIFNYTRIKDPEFTTQILDTRIDLKRFNNKTGKYYNLMYDFLDFDKLRATKLNPRDKVRLYSKDATENFQKEVGIFGYVKSPGQYSLEESMYPEDLVLAANGFEISADQIEVTINRFEFSKKEERLIKKFNYSIDKNYLLGISESPKNEFLLEDKDIITVKKILGYEEPSIVTITGEVNYEQNIILEFKNVSFKDLIDYAGGLTDYANLNASTLTRNGEIISVDFNQLSNNDFIFEDGDEVFIASNKGIVSTSGAVENESNFIWKKGVKAKKYIKYSGGKLKKEAGKSYIIYPNGLTKKIGFLKNPFVLPNSVIVTNRKLEKENNNDSKFIDSFNRTFSIIASAITTALLATRL